MPQHIEPLDGGVVTARAPSILRPGELTQAQGVHYRPGSPSLFPAQERSRYDTNAPSLNVIGLADLRFDSGTNYLLVEYANGDLYTGAEDPPSALTLLLGSRSAASQMLALQYQNRYYIMDGVNRNILISEALAIRQQGLFPQTQKPGLAIIAGTWPLGAAFINKYYEYWATEIVKDAAGNLIAESDVDGTTGVETTSEKIDAVTDAVFITLSMTKINAGATHWRIYRSVGKDQYNDKVFPSGVSIGDMPIPASGADLVTFTDGVLAAVGPTLANNGTSGTWGTPANIVSDNGAVATAATSTAKKDLIASFPTVVTNDPIVGVVVEIEARQQATGGGAALEVSISGDGGATYSTPRGVPLSNTLTVRTIGSSTSLWGYPLRATSFDTNNFRVKLSAFNTVGLGAPTVEVDFVRYSVYGAGAPPTTGVAFPSIPVTINGQVASVGENGQPPISTTGDVFEDSLVLNDITNPSLIRYSVPGRPEAFPSIYYLDFETEDNDEVKNISTLGNRLVVGLANQVWRVNYLPNEDDATFNRGRAVDIVDPNHGIVGPMAATKFMGADGRPELAYLSRSGLRATDGFTSRPLCDDINWLSIFTSYTLIDRLIVFNDAKHYELIVLYTEGSAIANRRFWRLNYHPTHLKENGQLKASGPFVWGGATFGDIRAAVLVNTSAEGLTPFYGYAGGTANGRIYYQTAAGDGEITENIIVKTRRMYLHGFGNEWELSKLYLHGGAAMTTSTTLNAHRRDATVSVSSPKSISMVDGLARVDWANRMEGAAIQLDSVVSVGGTQDVQRIDFIVLEGEDMGVEDK